MRKVAAWPVTGRIRQIISSNVMPAILGGIILVRELLIRSVNGHGRVLNAVLFQALRPEAVVVLLSWKNR